MNRRISLATASDLTVATLPSSNNHGCRITRHVGHVLLCAFVFYGCLKYIRHDLQMHIRRLAAMFGINYNKLASGTVTSVFQRVSQIANFRVLLGRIATSYLHSRPQLGRSPGQ